MRAEIESILASEIKQSTELLRRHLLTMIRQKIRLDELNTLAEDPNLWGDSEECSEGNA